MAAVTGNSFSDLEYAAYAKKSGKSGISLSDQKLSVYNAYTGIAYSGVEEAEIAYLRKRTSLPNGNMDEMWRKFMVAQGVTNIPGSLNTMKYAFFRGVGFP